MIAAFILAQAIASLSYPQIQNMPPKAAGDALLSDKPHGPIEMFEAPTGGPLLPGMIEGQLVEHPTRYGAACVQKVWTVLFASPPPKTDLKDAKAESIYSTMEITLAPGSECPPGRYVHLNPNVDLDEGVEALKKLQTVTARSSRAHFLCVDKTSSKLCQGDKAIAKAVRELRPWTVTKDSGAILIWLGNRGGTVTELRFQPGQASPIAVARYAPAPF